MIGNYVVYEDGSIENCKGRLLSPVLSTKGYLKVGLTVKGERKFYYVARLVAEEFIPNPNGYKYVGFKDGNKENCSADNLYWKEFYNE